MSRYGRRMMRRLFQITGWLSLLAITVLSLVPPSYRPDLDIPHKLEHLAIFLATGLAFGLGYSNRYVSRIILLIAFVAAVELAQLLVPGRHARVSDFLVDALGVSIGVGLGHLVARRKIAPIADK
jgi:VanZ family protein